MGKNADIVKRLYAAFATGDVPEILRMFDPKIEWKEADNSLYADGNPYIGPEAVARGVFARAASDVENLAAVAEDLTDGGDAVIVEGHYTGRVRSTGTPLNAQFAHVWDLRDGKVVRFQQYTDTKQWAEATAS